MKIVLSIAGSDTGAGAGIQQDLKTINALGCYGVTAITALTAQNTWGVQRVMPVPADMVRSQLLSIFADFDVCAIKVGQIPDLEVAEGVVAELQRHLATHGHTPIVFDPVMISTSGHALMREDCRSWVIQHLFPLCTLITPNLPETAYILGRNFPDDASLLAAGQELAARFGTSFLIKGGHADSDTMTDRLFSPSGLTSFSSPKINSTNLHGTGCTLSSAIASHLALGHTLPDAVALSKKLIQKAIQQGSQAHIGHGNGPLII